MFNGNKPIPYKPCFLTLPHRIDYRVLHGPGGMLLRIPLGERNDLGRMRRKVELDRAPVTVVIREIFVDCGGDFFSGTLDGFPAEPHAVQLSDFDQLHGQLFQRLGIRLLCAGGAAALEQGRQILKGSLPAGRTDAAAVHADGIALL